MNDTDLPPSSPASPAVAPAASSATPGSPAAAPAAAAFAVPEAPAAGSAALASLKPAVVPALAGVALLAAVVSLSLVWTTQQRVKALEQELVRRQQTSQDQSTEARLLARQARETAADVAGKLGLLEARVAESALQRTQVEELIQSLSRSRDENVLADVEAAVRVAQQQSAITGSAEPMVAALRQADERLARYNQPRLERVRRAVARDLERARSVSVADVPTLSIRLDEAVRQIDELPLLSMPERRMPAAPSAPASGAVAARAASAAASRTPPQPGQEGWLDWARGAWRQAASETWAEIRSLIRVTPIERPEAMLIAPDQAYFLRENLKLRLLNARLALLSRQFDQAQGDLAQAQLTLGRYFDGRARRVAATEELLRQVASQARQVTLPRPDDTLAALAAASAGR